MAIASSATEHPHEVCVERNVLVPLDDGVTLAADLYLPETTGPFPTLISLYPYRKDDIIGSFSAYVQRWFAERGYAHLLVDVRGSGGSAGRWVESMHPIPEGVDGARVVEWAAAQEWCDGSVGVWGISYGGLMAFATAAERPSHLKAIAPVYGFWDIQQDFVAPGGCSNMLGLQQRECIMLAQELAPPTFRDREGRWRDVWRERLERLKRDGPYSLRWFEHPDYDDYWRERVIPLARIEVPAFLIAGWRDLFPEAMSEAYRRISGPKQLLFGPWLHVQPDLAAREPFDWLSELLRFWNRWLRGIKESGEDQRPVWLFVQGDGGWRREADWPPARVVERVMYPVSGGALGTHQQLGGCDVYQATPLVGVCGGQWDAMATGMGYPLDQGPDDLLSLTYTSEPLEDRLELGGSPEAILHIERLDGTGPFSLVAKLVDVEPDGRAELITTGWLRVSSSRQVRIRLWATSYALARGHRLRLSVSAADFPRVWPDPTSPKLELDLGASELRLPVVPDDPEAGWEEPPRPPEVPPTDRFPWTLSGGPEWTRERDEAGDASSVTLGGGEVMRLPEGGTLSIRQRATASVAAAHPEGAALTAEAHIETRSADGELVEVEARSTMWRDHVVYQSRVLVEGVPLLVRTWTNM
jgi:putative CocE/NonD family hydrolase